MNVLCVIPARGGSKGIPLKNLKKVNGISLLGRAIRCAKESPFVTNIVVSTDHPEILEEALVHGADVPFVRPVTLSGDRVGDMPVLRHALMESESFYKKEFDYVIMLQPTSPLRTPAIVNEVCRIAIDGNYDAVWSVSEVDLKYHPYKQLKVTDNHLLEYFDVNGVNIIARQQLTPTYYRNGAAYVFSRHSCFAFNHTLATKTSFYVVPEHQISIDSIEDLKIVSEIIKRREINE